MHELQLCTSRAISLVNQHRPPAWFSVHFTVSRVPVRIPNGSCAHVYGSVRPVHLTRKTTTQLVCKGVAPQELECTDMISKAYCRPNIFLTPKQLESMEMISKT